jgi:alcohol dehydrogenase class IV
MQIETWFNTEDIKRFYFPGRIFVGSGVFRRAVTLCANVDGLVAVVADQTIHDMPFVREGLSELSTKTAGTLLVRGAPIAQEVEKFVQALDGPPAVVLAIGGGSATDFAKAVVASFLFGAIDGVGLRGNVARVVAGTKPVLVSVPTTAGSGAEASRYYVTYDKLDHHKVFGKSWNLVADWIMLDPVFLQSMPDGILVSCAFDAFVHLFETFICGRERSRMGEMFSLYGIGQVMEALNRATYCGERSDEVHAALMETATLGGVAISNVRTGNIHEAAGALLELTDLSHPETLFVFFRDAVEQYLEFIRDRERQLVSHLRLVPAFSGFTSMEDVIRWWETIFARVGLDSRIRNSIVGLTPSLDKVRNHIFQRIYSDKVWITKESPLALDEPAIRLFIDRSLARFGGNEPTAYSRGARP